VHGEPAMSTPVRQFDEIADTERFLEIVRGLLSELGHQSALASVRPGAHLERELGLGSLERVELLVRVEQVFGTRLNEQVLAEADTLQDLISALKAASSSPSVASVKDSPATGTSPQAISKSSEEAAEGLPGAKTFQDVLSQRGSANATKTHLIFFEDGADSTSVTFGELFAGAERVSADLGYRGIGRGDTVAIMLPTSREFFLIFAGVLLAGATPVPIYPPFRSDRIAEYAERQSAILANAGARLLVTFREATRLAKMLKPRVPSLEGVVTATALIESNAAAPIGAQLHSRGEDLALLQYTSGSTGQPKGVMLTHANLLANIRALGEAVAVRSDDVVVSWLPLYHDMGLIGAWLAPLYYGLPVVILSPLAFLSRPARWLRAFDRHRGTLGAAPNFGYELAAAKVSDADLEGLDLSSWRGALNGAEPVLPATLDRFAGRFARCGFRREALLPVYGLAEASVAVTIPQPGRGPRVDRIDRSAFEREGRAVPAAPDAPADDANVISFVSVGRAIPRHEVRIVDGSGRDAGERMEGRLWFRGPSVTRGYYRNDAATVMLFPQGESEGWVDSGDRAYRSEDEFYITGRVKDIIIHAGRNLYPHEIEDAVAQVPGVRKGCVVALGAADRATGTERLVVVAESRERGPAAQAHLAQAITAHLSTALGVPPDVVKVVAPNTVPKTSSGKVQRDMTKKRFLSGELGSTAPPAWLQITRLAMASVAARVRPALHRAGQIVFGCYALALLVGVVVPAWLLVLVAPSRQAAAYFTSAALRAFFALGGWRVRVEGRQYLQENVPCMIVSNHTSYLDVIVLMAALGVNYHFVAKDEVASMPIVRTFLRKLGHFAFNRQDSHARLQQADEIEQALRSGESVLVFAEGTFTAQTGVRPFQLGAFKAAITARRPVVPLALNGTRQALRDGTLLPRHSRITITLCPPIFPQSGAPDWHEIVRLRDATRETIARYAGEPLL
jgi:1-acyl-sn-glycerol-3-phosphate acyltransferase